MKYARARVGAIILAFALAACGANPAHDTTAATGPEPPVIKERQANFKSISKAFKAIRTQLENSSPDMAAIAVAAGDLNAAALKVEGHFPEGTSVADGFDTETLAIVWEEPSRFAEASQRLVDASAEMVELAQSGDVAAVGDQVGAIGGSCKNCHDNFRLDTD